jgi:hypothetical protein
MAEQDASEKGQADSREPKKSKTKKRLDIQCRAIDNLDRMTLIININSQKITGLLELQTKILKQKLHNYNFRNVAHAKQSALKSLAILFDQGILEKNKHTQKAKTYSRIFESIVVLD